ncbi:hypothetical protein ACIRBX_28465 [Kitasatospora sp. NPDC096147]|uniref:hypothetical protein n=1 Tax=Kitasatospora sp. NPDC096147 TaxID=3364093 RepID=UPI0038274FC5
MSDAVSQHGFIVTRRGYAPEQVDHAMAALTAERDRAWEQLSVLGSGVREMERRLAEVRQSAADAPEPDYSVLSEQAVKLMGIADSEATAIQEAAQRAAEDARDEAYENGQKAAGAARDFALKTRTEADAAARRTDERTRAEAEQLRATADREARAVRDSATADAAKVRVAAAEAQERAEAKLAELRRRADETFAAAETKADTEDNKIATTAERRVREAEQHRESVLAKIKIADAEARAEADRLVEAARREAHKVTIISEREQREFAAKYEQVQQHLDHIKQTLAALTGAAVGQIEAAKALEAPATPAVAPALDAPADRPALDAPAVAAEELPTEVLPAVPPAAPLPPKPPAPPAVALGPVAAAPAQAPSDAPSDAPAVGPEVETRIVPKVVIVDEGHEYPSEVIHRG